MQLPEEVDWPPLLVIAMSVALLLLSSFATDVVPQSLRHVGFLIGALMFLGGVWWACFHATGRMNCLFVLLIAASGTALGGIFAWYGGVAVYRDFYPAPPGPPKTRVRLIPEAVMGERLNFHFTIANDGPGDIEVMLASFQIPGDYQNELHSADRRTIRAGDELSVPIHALNRFLTVKRGVFQFEYRVIQTGIVRHARYVFQLPDVATDAILPTSSADDEGPGQFQSEAAFFDQKFAMPEAGLGFGFGEVKDGKPNTFQYAFHGRTILVNMTNRDAYFITSQKGRWRVLYGKLAVTNDAHHYMLVGWSDNDNWVLGNLDDHPMKEIINEQPRSRVRAPAKTNTVGSAT